MIRPLTIATVLLACGSGLYLYQSKHEVQVLDRVIAQTVRDTTALREQSRLLAAEWTMLNDPERLRQFSDTYLNLKSIAPSQFTSLADLNNRLPAPRVEVPSHGLDGQESIPTAVGTDLQPVPEPGPPAVAEEILPIPPIPAMPPVPIIASATRPADIKASVSRPVVTDGQSRPAAVADARPSEQRPSEQHVAPRVAEARAPIVPPVTPQPRPIILAAPRPMPANAPVSVASAPVLSRPAHPQSAMVAVSEPYSGSLLGMARGSMPPAPRPTPVNATYNSN